MPAVWYDNAVSQNRYVKLTGTWLAAKVPVGPDRKRMLSDQAFHIRWFFPGMQPQKMPAGFEGN